MPSRKSTRPLKPAPSVAIERLSVLVPILPQAMTYARPPAASRGKGVTKKPARRPQISKTAGRKPIAE